MKLTPREKDKLLISLAAIVAKNRLSKGIKLNYPEAINTGLFEKKYLNSFSTLNNNSAVATIIIVGNKFLNNFNNLSETLTNNENTTSNYSQWDNKLIVRLLSKDSYNLKFAIDKILSYFFECSKIPKVWNI